MNTNDMFQTIRALPVVVIKNIDDTIPTLRALCEGGLPAAEITFRTACAADAIRLGVKEFLAFDKIIACGGSFMMKGDIVANCKKLAEVLAQ